MPSIIEGPLFINFLLETAQGRLGCSRTRAHTHTHVHIYVDVYSFVFIPPAMFCWQVNNPQPRAAGGLRKAGPRGGGKSPCVPAWYRPGQGKRGAWGSVALAGGGEQTACALKTRCRRGGNSGPGPWTSGGLHLANVVIVPVLQTREWAEHGVPRPVHSVFTLCAWLGAQCSPRPSSSPCSPPPYDWALCDRPILGLRKREAQRARTFL